MTRDYDELARGPWGGGDRQSRMQQVVDRLWPTLSTRGVSWLGFYLEQPDEPEDRRLVLGPHRDSPACSPIGLHGVCGQAIRTGLTRIVEDVKTLGDQYVACDPRDQSEIVIPLAREGADGGAVLDLDSRETASFGPHDDRGLRRVLEAAGLEPVGPLEHQGE
ncbi:MAG: GAF domain-containing protein [Planctomycetota bacterium]|jgi:putative methionine-R-sulfoxide reductase with GAF domain